MATVEGPGGDQRVLLTDVPWETYLVLRDEPKCEHLRMAYDRGDLELMSLSRWHGRLAHLIGRMIDAWTEELGIAVQACRTMSCQREDLERGFEPDNCYYVRNELEVRHGRELDLAIDPPPDLAVEVQVSPSALDKLEIYSAFGVPEVWVHDGLAMRVYELGEDGEYHSRETSVTFPQFPMTEAEGLLRELDHTDDTSLVRSFRAWVREHAR